MTDDHRKRFKLDHDLSIFEPVILQPQGTPNRFIIRAELLDHQSGKTQRTGRYIHLGMTAVDIMRLLGLLQEVQRTRGLPDYPEKATLIDIPAEKDRN